MVAERVHHPDRLTAPLRRNGPKGDKTPLNRNDLHEIVLIVSANDREGGSNQIKTANVSEFAQRFNGQVLLFVREVHRQGLAFSPQLAKGKSGNAFGLTWPEIHRRFRWTRAMRPRKPSAVER